MSAKKPRPCCKHCGKELKKFVHARQYPDGQIPKPGDRIKLYTNDDTEFVLVAVVSKRYSLGRWWCGLWFGSWGNYGDGLFCGLNCGYHWARNNCPGRAYDGVPS